MVQDVTIDDSSLHLINVSMAIPHELRERLKYKGSWDNDRGKSLKSHPPRNEASCHLPMKASDSPTMSEPALALFASHGTSGILDTGATKSVIGSKLLPSFLEGLPKEVRSQLSRTSCEVWQSGNFRQQSSVGNSPQINWIGIKNSRSAWGNTIVVVKYFVENPQGQHQQRVSGTVQPHVQT